MEIDATISGVRSYGGHEDKVIVEAGYESGGTIGSLTMYFPPSRARDLYVGRHLLISVSFSASSMDSAIEVKPDA